jgi:chitodextrinase
MKRLVSKQKHQSTQQSTRGRPRRLKRFTILGFVGAALIGGAFGVTGQETVKAAACTAPTADMGTDVLTFTVPETGQYTVWTRMIAPDANNNSINMQIDQTDCFNVGGGTFAATTWQDNSSNWVNYANGTPSTPVRLNFTQGQHTIKFIGTKAGVQVDKVLITANTTLTPTGVCNDCLSGDTTPPTINMTPLSTTTDVLGNVTLQATAADASGIAKVDFLIDGQVVGTDTSAPYSFDWISASVPNGTHELKVQATDTEGNTAASGSVTITTNNITVCTDNPDAPANLRVSGSNGTSVTLTWDAATVGDQCQLKAYRIFRDGTQVSSTSSTSFSDTGLNPGESHTYTVMAVDMSDHTSPQSTSVTGTTADDSMAPTVPANVRVSLATSSSVALTWTASTDNNAVTSYVVYRNGSEVGTSASNSFTDTSVTANTTYSYEVAAKDGAGNMSGKSPAASAKTLDGSNDSQGGKIYVNPASGSYTLGDQFTVEVREDSGESQVIAVGAQLSYSANLQFVSIDDNGSAFEVSASKNGGTGKVNIERGAYAALKGDQLVAKVTFKVLAAGTGTIDVLDDSQALDVSTYVDVIGTHTGGSYTLANPVVNVPNPGGGNTNNGNTGTSGGSGTTSTPKPSTGSSSSSSSSGSTSTTTKPATGSSSTPTTTTKTTTTIAPEGNSQPVTLPNDSEVELSDPVVVQTVPDSSQTTEKVEYYLKGKLIATVKESPYSYSVNTKNLKNGSYTLTTKTYYSDGTIDTKNATLVVKNPMDFHQIMLQLGAFAWVIILLLIMAAGAVWYFYFRSKTGGDGDDYSDTDGYMFGPNGQTGGPAGPNYGPPAQFSQLLPLFKPIIVPVAVSLDRY